MINEIQASFEWLGYDVTRHDASQSESVLAIRPRYKEDGPSFMLHIAYRMLTDA